MRTGLLVIVSSVVVVTLAHSLPVSSHIRLSTPRQLEEENAASYSLRNGPCIRMKVAQDNDGDDDDGNSYFYNGAYRAQYERYVSFFLCDDDDCDDGSMYVTDMNSYLETMTEYVQNYCGSCANQCRRRLEDEEEEEEQAYYDEEVDCSTCSNECSPYLSGNGGADETEYLECQYAYEDGDLAYYSAPQCDDGKVTIGLFYDDECSIKTNTELDKGFEYGTFHTIERIDLDCSNGACDNLLGNAVNCGEGNDGDYGKLCRAAEKAGRVPTYYQKPWYKKIHLKGIIITIMVFAGLFAFLAYSYFVHHNNAKIPLAELDHDTQDSDIPEIS